MASEILKRLSENLARQIEDEPLEAVAPANPRMAEIVRLLTMNPLLVEPTRRFINQKIREINGAALSALYSPEEIEALKTQATKADRP